MSGDDPGPSSNYYRAFPATADGPLRPPEPPRSPILGATLPPHQPDRDYYALLNLPKDAPDSAIRDRYRSLATTWHPDRQRSDSARLAAHTQFTEIQRAYEVLIDPMKRTVYDMFGEEGLKTSWEVGPRVKTTEEMRKWFMGQAYEKKSLEAEVLVKPKSEMEVVLDARAVFLPRTYFQDPDQLKHDPISRALRVRPGRAVMKHSFEIPVSPNTQFVIEGQALSRNGRGGANILGTVKHQFSPKLWFEGGITCLNPRIFRAKGTYTIDEDQYLTANIVAPTVAAPPQLGFTYGRRLYQDTTGFMTFEPGSFSLGPWGASRTENELSPSSLSIGITNSTRSGSGWTVQTSASLASNQVSADYSIPIPGGLKMKIGAEAGLGQSVAGFVTAEGKLSENVRAGLVLQMEIAGGIILKLRFNRLGQKLSIPVLLAEKLDPKVLLGTTLLPAISYYAIYNYYLVPRKKQRLRERVRELREENKEFIRQKREEAIGAREVLEKSVATKVVQEKERNGLIILSATYGLASKIDNPIEALSEKPIVTEEDEEEETIDVTIPIQALVQDSRLYIPGGKGKFNVLGFYDPCIGENKKLKVQYSFRGRLHEVVVEDASPLRAPVRSKSIQPDVACVLRVLMTDV
ncbi:hypothetical protein L198_05615 [Cryptococcus wingfieldii CBS 7118]|uniref:J domain-containing protein n=1 Tax=Cryptococcus wingfieldii CBS 7118 TaxID=1295528 RepID=A0A1E3IW49_9TREE|nr:hypothetical protein L198_05615 [Cryptococcus wingfieldii CBS 7118]ODN92819.1 hypothetical protein L198_05615 [Cryptococcus wingfieldii CBS 7118]